MGILLVNAIVCSNVTSYNWWNASAMVRGLDCADFNPASAAIRAWEIIQGILKEKFNDIYMHMQGNPKIIEVLAKLLGCEFWSPDDIKHYLLLLANDVIAERAARAATNIPARYRGKMVRNQAKQAKQARAATNKARYHWKMVRNQENEYEKFKQDCKTISPISDGSVKSDKEFIIKMDNKWNLSKWWWCSEEHIDRFIELFYDINRYSTSWFKENRDDVLFHVNEYALEAGLDNILDAPASALEPVPEST